MALILTGGGVAAISGSVGGVVFSHNRSGAYMRNRSMPVNPQTDRQNKIRAAISQLAQQWSGSLTQAQRDAWEVYAAAITRSNALGGQIKLTGFNHFIRSNSVLVQSDLPAVDAGPTILTLPGADPEFACTVDEAGQEISVAFDEELNWLDQDTGHMIVQMSLPKATGTNFVGGPFRLAGVLDGDAITPLTSPQVIPVPFPVAEGQVIVCRARIVEEDGRLSDPFQDQSSVTA